MALKRLTKRLRPKMDHKNIFQTPPEIILRSNLIEFFFANSSSLLTKYKNLFDLIQQAEGYFLTLTWGVFEIGIIISQERKS